MGLRRRKPSAPPRTPAPGSTALPNCAATTCSPPATPLAELLGTAATPANLAELTRLTAILQRAHGTSATLRPEVYDTDLDALTAALAPWRERREQGVKLGWGRRRRAPRPGQEPRRRRPHPPGRPARRGPGRRRHPGRVGLGRRRRPVRPRSPTRPG
ncbi:hypothetical protein [Kitasatospora albolonga]|uniref:hypothetical protein n=1 Tax=Kitasatospora albolonga TaxID=68173 RepID=UPI0031EFA3A7